MRLLSLSHSISIVLNSRYCISATSSSYCIHTRLPGEEERNALIARYQVLVSSQLDGLGRVGAFCMADHGAMQVREDPARLAGKLVTPPLLS